MGRGNGVRVLINHEARDCYRQAVRQSRRPDLVQFAVLTLAWIVVMGALTVVAGLIVVAAVLVFRW